MYDTKYRRKMNQPPSKVNEWNLIAFSAIDRDRTRPLFKCFKINLDVLITFLHNLVCLVQGALVLGYIKIKKQIFYL